MNKMMTSAIIIGAGAWAYNYAQKNNWITNRQMRKIRKSFSNIF